jgi:hypothetical protein
MNLWDYFYIIAMPLGYSTSIMDTWRIIQTKSAKSRSIYAYAMSLGLLSITMFRALLSVHDFLFWLNATIYIVLNSFQLVCILKWRKK